VAGFGVHFHDHAWHMHLCGCLSGGITIIFRVDALVAGIIPGSYSFRSMHTHMSFIKVYQDLFREIESFFCSHAHAK